MTTLTPTSASIGSFPSIDWAPVFAGAIGAAALGLVFIAFGAAIGLTLTSPWPGSGLSLVATGIFVMYWTALVQILSFAAGGYIAGRLRPAAAEIGKDERQFRDGAHGFLVWGVGVVMMALVTAFGGGVAARSGSTVAAGTAAGIGAASQNGPAPADYAVDLLLRPGPNTPVTPTTSAPPASNDAAIRQEIGRLFSSVIRNRELTVRDRDYLVTVVQARSGLSPTDAQQRVTEAVAEARNLEMRAREQADRARKASVLTAFTAAAALMIGLAVACAGAALGGRHRDENTPFSVFGRPVW
jgi:hypothetical protein